jgi:hypothetical protein
VKNIIAELDAKAWQASRRGSPHEEHCCYRAAREIERLRSIEKASDAEKGWRSFWNGFSDHLDLGRTQRTYGWHDLMDACNRGMEEVKRNCADSSKLTKG